MLFFEHQILLNKSLFFKLKSDYLLFIFVVFLILITQSQIIAQNITGRVIDANTRLPISFARIYLNSNTKATLADATGYFEIKTKQKPFQICAKAVLHRSVCILNDTTIDKQNDFFLFELKENAIFYVHKYTDVQTAGLIKKVVYNKIPTIYNFTYKIYNKITVGTDSLPTFKKQAKKWIKSLDVSDDSTINHHLFLIESYSEVSQRLAYEKLQNVVAARISGIKPERAIRFATGWQISSIYDQQIILGKTKYIGVLAANPFKRYNFQIYDTCITTDNDTIFIVKFQSKTHLSARGLKGFLYISSRNGGHAIAAELEPALQQDHTLSLHLQNQWLANKLVAAQWHAIFQLPNLPLSPSKIPIFASNSMYFYGYKFNQKLDKNKFGHIGLNAENIVPANDTFWQSVRASKYMPADSQTFEFYQKQKNLVYLDRIISLGNEIYEKKLPVGKLDLLLDRLIRINQFEGIRLGIGFATNQKFDPNWQLSGYIARGLADRQTKFGVEINKKINDNTMIGLHYMNDLRESGGTQLCFQTNQFETEGLRLLRANKFDYIKKLEIPFQIRIYEYLQTQISAFYENLTPLFDYKFADNTNPNFNYFGLHTSVRLAWAEQYSSFNGRKKLLSPSPFPSLLFGFMHGWGLSRASNNYFKTEIRLDYAYYFHGFGRSALRLEGGWLTGKLPYSLLFHGKGSWRPGTVITHNSFETMRYNEFVFSRYGVFYYTHNFGNIHIEGLPFYPSLEISHNVGIGKMGADQDKNLHTGVEIKSMEKGYFESGLFVNDLFVFKISSLRLGIGAGGFRRYGPYSQTNKTNNTVLKFALKIS